MAEQHGKALVPQIRFAGFTDPWEQRKLGDIVGIYDGVHQTPNYQNSGVMFLSVENIATLKSSKFISEEDFKRDYKVFPQENDILMTRIGDVGTTNVVTDNGLKAFYVSLALLKYKSTDPYFLSNAIQSDYVQKGLANRTLKTAIPMKINKDEIGKVSVMLPVSATEQQQIGTYFRNLDNLITLHQRKYDKLCVLKKSMLDKMFPKGGSLYPEIRFAGFTDPWEQRKLSELVEIERGGSPRPIERYITDDPCGLNWVKIGDAPELGRYITQTAEKIKPEGLAKTRQVYPGDLVLSNSMSFGRPYIMAIKGCIHDGWLLIRDAQKHFDPIFLCHMLGAPRMLNQYRMFAAGSTVNNLNKELVGKAIVSLPSKDEQREIGIVLDRLDSLITLHQRKLELLRNIKKSMLDKMFV